MLNSADPDKFQLTAASYQDLHFARKKNITSKRRHRAATRDFQQCGILTSVDSDEPVQPPVKLRNIKWWSVGSLTLIEYSSDKQRL